MSEPTISGHWIQALERATESLSNLPDLEIRSALKQAGSDEGIEYGEPMQAFVEWAEREMEL